VFMLIGTGMAYLRAYPSPMKSLGCGGVFVARPIYGIADHSVPRLSCLSGLGGLGARTRVGG
jgi:hypothetical protein